MWWRVFITALLAAVVLLLLLDRDRIVGLLVPGDTPHDAYVRSLEAAGLADTALARDWIAAAERALRAPETRTAPLEVTIQHPVAEARAYGYRLELKRGRVLKTSLDVEGTEPAQVFIDVYAHLSRQAVRTGERVKAGDVIGYVGTTGNARGTPPHLHFGIYALREGPIDPLPFVSGGRGAKPEQATTGSGG
jgi:hypothetical protein